MTEFERVYIRFRGRTIGPLTPDKVTDMVRRGQVTRMHELSGDGLSWVKADEFGNFFPRQQAYAGDAGDMAAGADAIPPGGAVVDDDGEPVAMPNEDAMAQWYAHVNGEKQGPVSMDQMRLYHEAKILKKDSLVWKSGMQAWKPASEALPQLFAPAAKSKQSDAVVTSTVVESSSADGGALSTESNKQHVLVMILGVCLLIAAVVIFVVEIMALNQGGRRLKSDYMGAAVHLSLGGVLLISGVTAIQAATKMKAAFDSGSSTEALTGAQAINQFWLFSSISTMIWLIIIILIVIAAAATGVPVLNVLS